MKAANVQHESNGDEPLFKENWTANHEAFWIECAHLQTSLETVLSQDGTTPQICCPLIQQ